MTLMQLFRLPLPLCSATAVTLRRNIGVSAVLFNQTKDLDPVQRLYLDKIREYANKSKAAGGGIVDADASYHQKVNEETDKLLKRFGLYGKGDPTKFPEFTFPEPAWEELTK